MFCMHCGQQLPDGAKFCYNCGNKTFSKEDLPAEPMTEIDKETIPQPPDEPVYVPEEEPIVFPTEEPVFSPAEEPIYQTEEPVDFAQTQKGKHKNSTGGTKRKIFLILGIAAALIVALVIALVTVNSSKHEPEIPDPEYYFALPLSDTSQNDGMITYTINANHVEDDLSAAVYAYIDTLRNDYDFMINTIEEDSGYINANLMSFGDSYGEILVIYQHDYVTNKIEVKTTTNIRLVSGVSYYDDADTYLDTAATSLDDDEPTQRDVTNRDPAVLPDVAKVDSTGTFSYFTSFFHTEYDDRLFTSYISNDPNAV
ncbi:MAG: zinc-ribbon domain-containing protein, partial [Firmicutes bacterium]|nr:zinc-ribbon domain-containing protein [Bacillota bacterium]